VENITAKLNNMKNAVIDDNNAAELVDINSIVIDENSDMKSKVLKYIEDVKNPYLFKVGDTIVKINFSDSDKTINEKIAEMVIRY